MVIHPGVQHSRELARALENAGLLQSFMTSLDERYAAFVPNMLRRGLQVRSTGLPRSKVRAVVRYELVARVLRLLSSTAAWRSHDWASDHFGRAAGRHVMRVRPRLVTAFEGDAEHVFAAAKACGASTILEAPSLHAAWQPNAESGAEERRRASARKAREIELADHVVVLSTLARDSYVAAGFPQDRIVIVPPGVWSDRVAQPSDRAPGPVRVLFVGNIKRAKGVDLLIDAFRELRSSAWLVLAGPIVEPDLLARLPERVEVTGKLDPDALRSQYARADLLVLPSRADGFGMVVGEAMRSGLPAIVSSATGARDVVLPGRNGWIFPSEDASSLAHLLRDAVDDPPHLREMGAMALEDSAGLTWERYAERTVQLYRALLAGTQPTQVAQ